MVAPDRPAQWHRRVLMLAFPIVLANLTQPILSAVDTAVAGHLPGPEYLGGVALGGVFFNFVFWGFGCLRMGTTGLVAQAHGAARHYLVWAAWLPVVSVWGFQFDGVFIGATRTRELLLTMAFSAIAFWLLAVTLQPLWGNHGLWFAMLAFMALRGMSLGALLPRVWRASQLQAA